MASDFSVRNGTGNNVRLQMNAIFAEIKSVLTDLQNTRFLGFIPSILVDATSGPVTVTLPDAGVVRYIRSDETENNITIFPGVEGQTVGHEESILGPTVKDEGMSFQLIGTNWYVIK